MLLRQMLSRVEMYEDVCVTTGKHLSVILECINFNYCFILEIQELLDLLFWKNANIWDKSLNIYIFKVNILTKTFSSGRPWNKIHMLFVLDMKTFKNH